MSPGNCFLDKASQHDQVVICPHHHRPPDHNDCFLNIGEPLTRCDITPSNPPFSDNVLLVLVLVEGWRVGGGGGRQRRWKRGKHSSFVLKIQILNISMINYEVDGRKTFFYMFSMLYVRWFLIFAKDECFEVKSLPI